MTTEVAELAPGDIQRPTGAQPAPQPIYQETAPATPMTAEQTAGVAKLAEMRQKWADNPDKRDQIGKQMNELARHVFNGGPKPAWHGEQTPDPRMTSNEPFDPLASAFETALVPMTTQEGDRLVSHAKIVGLAPESAAFVAEVAKRAGFDYVSGKTLADRAVHHAREGWGLGVQMSEADVAELAEEFVRSYGSIERAAEESAYARLYVEHAGLGDLVRSFGSLNFDVAIVGAFAYRARVLGLGAERK